MTADGHCPTLLSEHRPAESLSRHFTSSVLSVRSVSICVRDLPPAAARAGAQPCLGGVPGRTAVGGTVAAMTGAAWAGVPLLGGTGRPSRPSLINCAARTVWSTPVIWLVVPSAA